MATTTLMSFAEFERQDFGAEQLELLNGELIRLPPPFARHMEIVERLYRLLHEAVETLGSECEFGTVHMEMGYLFQGEPRSWLRPDVSIDHPHQSREDYYLGAPMIAFEVVSEHDNARDLEAKVAEYLANGSQEVWVIHPKVRHALVYGPGDAIRKESRAIRSDLVPGLDIPLDRIL